MQQFRNPTPTSWFLGVAEDCCILSLLLAVPSCIYSFLHGVTSLHRTSSLSIALAHYLDIVDPVGYNNSTCIDNSTDVYELQLYSYL